MGMGGSTSYSAIFSTPQGLWVTSSNQLFVADALSGQIKIFNLINKEAGVPLGSLGINEGELHYPLDVLVDEATNDVYVADNQNGRITVFVGGGVRQ